MLKIATITAVIMICLAYILLKLQSRHCDGDMIAFNPYASNLASSSRAEESNMTPLQQVHQQTRKHGGYHHIREKKHRLSWPIVEAVRHDLNFINEPTTTRGP